MGQVHEGLKNILVRRQILTDTSEKKIIQSIDSYSEYSIIRI